MRLYNIIITIFWLFSILSFNNLKGNACDLSVDSSFKSINLRSKISVFSTVKNISVESAIDSLRFSLKTDVCSSNLSPGFKKAYYWVSVQLSNLSTTDKHLYIELNNPHIDTVVAYDINKGDIALIDFAGDQVPFDYRDIKNRRFVFEIELLSQTQKTILLKLDKRTGAMSFPLKLWDKQAFDKSEKVNNLFYLFYFGGLIFLAVFSLSLGLIIKDKRVFVYGLYISVLGLYLFTALGFSFQYIYPESSSFNNSFRSQLMVFGLSIFILFSAFFLKIDIYKRNLYKLLLLFSGLFMSLGMLSIIFNSFFFNHIYFFLKLVYLLVFISIPILIFSFSKTYKYNRKLNLAYLIAFGFIGLGALVSIFVEFGWINEDYMLVNPILLASIIELFILSISFIYEIKVVFDRKRKVLVQKNMEQKQLTEAYINGTEAEAQRISQDIHDNIGSRLALIKSRLSIDKSSQDLYEEVSFIFSELRNISQKLSLNKLKILGLASSIETLFDNLAASTDIKVNLYIEEDITFFNSKIDVQLYRVIQEIVQNIIKHSHASRVDCQMIVENNTDLIVTIDDDGVGFEKNNYNKASNGLLNIQLRLDSVSCKYEIDSSPGKGTHYIIWCHSYFET